MEKIRSLSDKRLIVECTVNGRQGNFLVDTGASVGLIAEDRVRKFGLLEGRRYPGTLIGAGGEISGVRYCNTFANLKGKDIPQFLIADISAVRESIRRETGVEILGIISLPQMKIAGMQVDANDNLIIIE
jgi:hypothetical protein